MQITRTKLSDNLTCFKFHELSTLSTSYSISIHDDYIKSVSQKLESIRNGKIRGELINKTMLKKLRFFSFSNSNSWKNYMNTKISKSAFLSLEGEDDLSELYFYKSEYSLDNKSYKISLDGIKQLVSELK